MIALEGEVRKALVPKVAAKQPETVKPQDNVQIEETEEADFDDLYEQVYPDSIDPYSRIRYNKDGTIVSSNKQYNKEINELLNLNTTLLKLNRKRSWESVVTKLVANKGKQLNKAQIKQYIAKYSSMHNKDGQMKYIPYCGVVLYNLNKKLRKLCSQ